MEFRFAETERALALTHAIADDKRSAFANRLRHLQRLGFPPGVNTGRGKVAAYGVGEVFLLGVALELMQLGLNPERAVDAITDDLFAVAMGAGMAAYDGPPTGGFKNPIFYYLDPSALNDLMRPGRQGDRASASFFYAGLGIINEHLAARAKEGFGRVALINVSFLVHRISGFLVKPEDKQAFYDRLAIWADHLKDGVDDGHP
ncbi:MAG: hypothetical protein HEQ21_14425 [Blastomonas sp.]|uniref:hypothetical protein n=1 Tax=Blastomonas sp. TaxID=1909299 RepID=UPI002585F32A|nr:hypothetical protein [Blastomonas sp.]MCO5794014.1 hypothetical protein [Blastomonas sp.]